MELLDSSKMLLLNFSFVMIYVIRTTLVLPKRHLNHLKDYIFECFFKKYNKRLFFSEVKFPQNI